MYEQEEQTKFSSKHPLVRLVLETYKRDLLRFIEKAGPHTILDVGCGEGTISSFIKMKATAMMYGADYSWKMLSSSQKVMPVVGGDVAHLPFKKRSVDLCLCLEVLEHLDNPYDALRELARVGRKSLISVPNDMIMRLGNISRGSYLETFGNFPGHTQHFNYFSFRRFLKKEFVIEEYKISGIVWIMALVSPATLS
jgi:ubiquinone/menaquinone biosynthesis C-methylase UbiE